MSRIYGTGIMRSMRIAFRNFFRKPITVQYPHEKVELPERARWAVAMKLDEQGDHKCTACVACERACPDFIIEIQFTTAEDRSKHIDHWRYEIGACMMCGLCVEACPYDAIEMSHDYELARTDPDQLSVELLSDVPAVPIKRRSAEPGVSNTSPRTVPAEGGER
jgi:NADH-quinone oxidoreductase subunit I